MSSRRFADTLAALGFTLLNVNTIDTMVRVMIGQINFPAQQALSFAGAMFLLLPGLLQSREYVYIIGTAIGGICWLIIGVMALC